GEHGYIDAQQPGKIPSHRVDEQAIARQHETTGQDNEHIGPAQTSSNHRIASDLQEGRTQEDEPGGKGQIKLFHLLPFAMWSFSIICIWVQFLCSDQSELQQQQGPLQIETGAVGGDGSSETRSIFLEN